MCCVVVCDLAHALLQAIDPKAAGVPHFWRTILNDLFLDILPRHRGILKMILGYHLPFTLGYRPDNENSIPYLYPISRSYLLRSKISLTSRPFSSFFARLQITSSPRRSEPFSVFTGLILRSHGACAEHNTARRYHPCCRGVQMPLALRPLGEESSHTLVSATYMDGIMDGEAWESFIER